MTVAPLKLAETSPPASVAGSQPVFAQCMLRVKDPEASREYYEKKLGMKFLTRLDFEELGHSEFFYAWTEDEAPDATKSTRTERAEWLWSRPYPTVKLTWNWQSGEAGEVEKYVNGNTEPKGFGHLGMIVDDCPATVEKLKAQGVNVVREGKPFADVGNIGFVADPDGYWMEVIERPTKSDTSLSETGLIGRDPVFAQTMLRVRDPRPTIEFFQKLGFKFLTSMHFPEGNFSLYFLAYTDMLSPDPHLSRAETAKWLWQFRACTIELTHNWGTESAKESMYVNGNSKPNRGFGHLSFIVSDIYETTRKLEADGYKVVRQPSKFHDVGECSFVQEPDTGYWVELIQRTGPVPFQPYHK